MPRNVRNFWLDIYVDGRKRRIETGPATKTGGFSIVIRQRDQGEVMRVAHVEGREQGGHLILTLSDAEATRRIEVRTER